MMNKILKLPILGTGFLCLLACFGDGALAELSDQPSTALMTRHADISRCVEKPLGSCADGRDWVYPDFLPRQVPGSLKLAQVTAEESCASWWIFNGLCQISMNRLICANPVEYGYATAPADCSKNCDEAELGDLWCPFEFPSTEGDTEGD
ncbi:hypothetical protein [uncultured Nitratireductor sp.]|uniref:hypothetical protein n=1 Tax=uncultured Nitratireductor sp. TaxID=520953 RepID=UPI0025F5D767|nr:hypothetical protein [uncultured Nitratireductor sp.]